MEKKRPAHQEMIVYISKATRPLSADEVKKIAALAALRNRNSDITGLLLQVGNYFVQVLEGEADPLSALLTKIERDKRHTEVRVIYKASTHARMFAQWNMGYFNIEQYYQANRLDVMQLRRTAEEMFATCETSKEAIVQLIKSVPDIMAKWQTVESEPVAA